MHEESGFRGITIIVWTESGASETEFGVKRDGRSIGFADFQKNVMRAGLCGFTEKMFENKAGVACAPVFCGDGEIENFEFFAEVAPLQYATDAAFPLADGGKDFSDGRASVTLAVGGQREGEARLVEDGANSGSVLGAAQAVDDDF